MNDVAGHIDHATATAPAPAYLPMPASAIDTIDGEPWLQALSSCMVAVLLFAMLIDLIQTKARRAEARNRKKHSLERLKNHVAQNARAHENPKHGKDLRSTVCADEPLVVPVVLKKDGQQSDQVVTPPSSPNRLDAEVRSIASGLKVAELQLTTSAKKETGSLGTELCATRRRWPRPHVLANEGGDPMFGSRLNEVRMTSEPNVPELQLTTIAKEETLLTSEFEAMMTRRRRRRRRSHVLTTEGGDPVFASQRLY